MSEDATDLLLDNIKVGDTARTTWLVTSEQISAFATLSGDRNPLHMDADYARGAGFDGRIAHGLLIGAKLSGLLGMKLPGRRCLLLEQSLAYPNPVYAGDRILLEVQVRNIHAELGIVELKASGKKSGAGNERSLPRVVRGTVTCKILP